ncbi:MAG TPA: chemotaxis protein CheA [Tabrizicola sp.]|nr:chemotaxis protein CheA [Tabrizicola sp.]
MSTSIDIRQMFFQECEELLETLDDGLAQLAAGAEDDSVDPEVVNAVFRAVHSIKGGAAAFGLETLVRFAHQFETVLDEVRSGRLMPGSEIVGIFLRSADYLADLIASARDSVEPKSGAGPDLLNRLAQLVSPAAVKSQPLVKTPEPEPIPDDLGFQPLALALDFGIDADQATTFRIRFAPHRQFYAVGNDPILLLRALEALGEMSVEVDSSALPGLEEMDWAEPYLTWDITLATTETVHAVQEIFEFVDGLCSLEITTEASEPDISATPSQTDDVLPAAQVTAPPEPQSAVPTSPAARDVAAQARKSATPQAGSQKGSVRVDLELVDRLINIVGELVINQAVLAQCAQDAGLASQSDIGAGLDEFRNLARELQENIMAIRAQSVKQLFQRMARIVREASDIAGKSVIFETEGDAVEVDKTVIERLVDPLTHIIRNAVDHGLEAPQKRLDAGKTETGRVRLSAAHRSGRVLIEVSDDGAGINRPKVKQIAIDKGLIPPDAVLDDAGIDKLLFLPGFSTAEKVTDLSGRGVGMDVVRSAIQGLGGRVNISSVPGKGTTFSISLPLTLAVLDGMVVDVAGQTMVIPITAIIETLRPQASDIHHVAAAGIVVAVRQAFVPIIDLAETFGHRPATTDYSNMVLLLVETGQHERWALAVDRIYDQRQVVIKGLESNYGHVPGVAAATILGDGKIALIIDPDETAQRRLRLSPAAAPQVTEEV